MQNLISNPNPITQIQNIIQVNQISEHFPKCLIIPIYNGEYLPEICNQYLYSPSDPETTEELCQPNIISCLDQLDLPEDGPDYLILPHQFIQQVFEEHSLAIIQTLTRGIQTYGLGDDTFFDYIPDAIETQQFLAYGLCILEPYLDSDTMFNELLKPFQDLITQYDQAITSKYGPSQEPDDHLQDQIYIVKPETFIYHNSYFLK